MEPKDSDKLWYVIFTKPRGEQKAVTHLEEQGYTTYSPLYRCRKRRGSCMVDLIEPLFPRYLFIRLDKKNDNWAPIRSTPGVHHVVRFGLAPARMPNKFVDSLRENENKKGLQHISPPTLKQGDKVRILEGSMAGLEAIFKSSKGSDRAMIMLDILGKMTQVELEAERLAQV